MKELLLSCWQKERSPRMRLQDPQREPQPPWKGLGVGVVMETQGIKSIETCRSRDLKEACERRNQGMDGQS